MYGCVGRIANKEKRVIKRWRLDRFTNEEVKVRYPEALKAEVHSFSESIKNKVQKGIKGHELVSGVLHEWESIVNRVAKKEVGEKMVVCGRAARWWDSELKDKISLRREVYKVIRGREDLWDEYCRLHKEVKELVRQKKLAMWKEVVEKANVAFEGSRKEFWAFVGRRTKAKNRSIASLKGVEGVSVTSTKGTLEVLQKHYQHLGRVSIDI